MLFVLFFVILVVALPAIGEVWSHGEDNVFNRSRREVVVVVEPYLERLQSTATETREWFAWLSLLSFLARLAKALLELLLRFIARITGG